MSRKAQIQRKTEETEIHVNVHLDGEGKSTISTSLPFMDHMLTLFARHSLIDLELTGTGDTQVDDHHLVEDLGICLGEAMKEAIGQKGGIERYGSALVPMDESLCSVVVDISGRPYLVYNVNFKVRRTSKFDFTLLKEFFKAFSDNCGITLHINLMYGNNNHHIAEAIFKAFALAFRRAVTVHKRIKGVLSTKGIL